MTESAIWEMLDQIPLCSPSFSDPTFPGVRCKLCHMDPSWERMMLILSRVPEEDWSRAFKIHWDSFFKREQTMFVPVGTEANIVSIGVVGLRDRARFPKTPASSHVEVLRRLGFRTMRYPDGRRYEIRGGWPGVRRLRASRGSRG